MQPKRYVLFCYVSSQQGDGPKSTKTHDDSFASNLMAATAKYLVIIIPSRLPLTLNDQEISASVNCSGTTSDGVPKSWVHLRGPRTEVGLSQTGLLILCTDARQSVRLRQVHLFALGMSLLLHPSRSARNSVRVPGVTHAISRLARFFGADGTLWTKPYTYSGPMGV